MKNTRGAQVSRIGNTAPGHSYPALCHLQGGHRSQCVLQGESVEELTARQHKLEIQWDSRYEKYVRKTGLYGLHKIGHIPTDHALISALVERWHQETHTFHFPVGEMTVTLQDVAVLLGLPIDGKALSSRTDLDWSAAVVELLGKEVTPRTFRKKSNVAINISWLNANFSCCPEKADEKTVQPPPLMYLDVHTCTFSQYRKEIDHLNDGNVKWNPYENQMDLLPPICSKNSDLWRTTAPLIHFWIVEMYNPGRVARQFNRYQVIPPPLCDTMDELHNLKNRSGKDWVKVHHVHLEKWENRTKSCLADERPYDISKNDEYKRWFSNALILYLNHPRGLPDTYRAAERWRKIAIGLVETFRDTTNQKTREFLSTTLNEARASIEDILESVGDEEIFAAFDKNLIEQPVVSQVHDNDAGPSCHPATKRIRRSSSSK
ncbi:hypothetical protein LUZ63_000554 [Rhynchospora breviuscula]|uniref:Aminotransferase-like plant mobile domain-containing protein n=1 Tax=Rhynchospora breviuscula TaxID=2022672 RepID=A0A9Q0CVR5_9POAL|nr:hypothetical protein LUZ63_000554 [Rhynchospora breviuscula]